MDADQTSEKSDVLESEQQGEAEQKPARLAQLTLDALEGVESLSAKQKEVLTLALKLGRDYPDNHYKYGSADIKQGGFDCSGAMYFILKQSGFQPPRTSSSQYDWVEKGGRLTKVSPEITSLDDPIFNKLKPGDLLFWSHTYQPTDGRTNGVTHVQMYLGREKKESRPVMIGSSDGRSYRGRRQDGYAVFDFRLPRKESKQKFVGFGSPPAP
jgi:cell wall-associated NlpC family hydrolase